MLQIDLRTMFVDLGALSLSYAKTTRPRCVSFVIILFVRSLLPSILPGEGGVGVWVSARFRLPRTLSEAIGHRKSLGRTLRSARGYTGARHAARRMTMGQLVYPIKFRKPKNFAKFLQATRPHRMDRNPGDKSTRVG